MITTKTPTTRGWIGSACGTCATFPASNTSATWRFPFPSTPSTPPTPPEPPFPQRRWLRYAKRLADAMYKAFQISLDDRVSSWATSFQNLNELDGIPIPRIRAALLWYCERLPSRRNQPFFLVIHTGRAFREKFLRLERAIARECRRKA